MGDKLTLAQMRSLVISKADMTGSSFPTDSSSTDYTTVDYFINSAAIQLYELLVDTFEDYFISTHTITLDGSESYLLPDDMYKVRKVYYKDGTNRYRLRRFDMTELDLYDDVYRANLALSNKYLLYRVMGNEIIFTPNPNSVAGTIELWYVPAATKLTDPDDELHYSIAPGWVDFVINDAVAQLLEKEESDPTSALQRREEARARILTSAADRDIGEVHHVSDVYDGPWGY